MTNEFNELKYQLEGLQNAIDGMMTGIEKQDVRYVKSQIRYMKEKAARAQLEAELLIESLDN